MEVVSVNEVHLAQPNERVSCFLLFHLVVFSFSPFFLCVFNVTPMYKNYICTVLGRLNFSSGLPCKFLFQRRCLLFVGGSKIKSSQKSPYNKG